MSPATNPTGAYTVPSVLISTARTGAANKANPLGMRAMQGRACATRGGHSKADLTLCAGNILLAREANFPPRLLTSTTQKPCPTTCVPPQPQLRSAGAHLHRSPFQK